MNWVYPKELEQYVEILLNELPSSIRKSVLPISYSISSNIKFSSTESRLQDVAIIIDGSRDWLQILTNDRKSDESYVIDAVKMELKLSVPSLIVILHLESKFLKKALYESEFGQKLLTNQKIYEYEHLKGIHTLDLLGCNEITDKGLQHLKGIHTLSVRYCNQITDRGLEHLKGIRNLEK